MALCVAVATASLATDLEILAHLHSDGSLTDDEYGQAKEDAFLASSASGKTAAAEGELQITNLLSRIMLSDKMTKIFARIVRDSVKLEVQEALKAVERPANGLVAERRLATTTGAATCTLSSCGSDEACNAWNKVLEDVNNCQECQGKKFHVNGLHGCTCTYTCAVPPAETSPPADADAATPSATSDVLGAASANLGTSSLWLAGDDGALAIGASAEVRLFKNTEGAHGFRTNANLTVDGDVVVQGKKLLAAINKTQKDLAELDAVAVKSSSAGSQTLGTVTAESLSLANGDVTIQGTKVLASLQELQTHLGVGFKTAGFSANHGPDKAVGAGWSEAVGTWSLDREPTLYSTNTFDTGGFSPTTGRFTAPIAGYYTCAAQMRLDSIGQSHVRMMIALNGERDFNNNGMAVIDGNSGSTDYRSMNVAGTLHMNKGDFVSVHVYHHSDTSWIVIQQSGFSCHLLGSDDQADQAGFHADVLPPDRTKGTGWSEVVAWTTDSGNSPALYAVNTFDSGGFDGSTGRFTAPVTGYYMCAAQLRMDSIGSTFTRMIIALNGHMSVHNGLHVIEGNSGSTDYRSMNAAGTLHMNKGDFVSVHVYHNSDTSWTVSDQSGFSCHLLVQDTRLAWLLN